MFVYVCVSLSLSVPQCASVPAYVHVCAYFVERCLFLLFYLSLLFALGRRMGEVLEYICLVSGLLRFAFLHSFVLFSP